MTEILLHSALIILTFMTAMFIIALILKDNGIVDVGWGIGFILVTVFTYLETDPPGLRHLILLVAVALWGIRLAAHILVRGIGKGEDPRYANWRSQWGKWVVSRSFFQVFMLQGVIMWVVLLPIMVVNSHGAFDNPPLGVPEAIGMLLFLIGFLWESIADLQLYLFKKKPENKGKIMTTGLWKYSRHPNYFGEMVLWWGIFIFAIPSGLWWVSVISPILITYLLTRVSGLPMLEELMEKRPGFKEYVENTPAFIPFIRKTK